MNLRRQHRLAVRQRYRRIRERHVAVFRGRELLAPDLPHDLKDPLVEHIPSADLLFDHLLARDICIHSLLRPEI